VQLHMVLTHIKPVYSLAMDEQMLAAWRALLNAHAAVTTEIEAALADADLPPLSWYDALWPLYRAQRRRLRVGALAGQVTLSRTGLTRLIDRLEREGLVEREPALEDRRGFYIALTREGAELLRRMWPVYERALGKAFAAKVRNPTTLRRALHPLSMQSD
jgi:DNA-binding MarR family transcriptional regulator